jgi:hypothetical protein
MPPTAATGETPCCLDLDQSKLVSTGASAVCLSEGLAGKVSMAETTKLSVEKALNKIREADAQKSKTARREEQIDALEEETKRLRAQRLRLEAHQRRSTKRD